jgi:hypothetical protein
MIINFIKCSEIGIHNIPETEEIEGKKKRSNSYHSLNSSKSNDHSRRRSLNKDMMTNLKLNLSALPNEQHTEKHSSLAAADETRLPDEDVLSTKEEISSFTRAAIE